MIRKILFTVILSAAFISSGQAKEQLNVIVSILPQAFLLEQIGKEKIDVSVMIPPGGNPHTYEPTPSQLQKLSRADLYIKVGSGVEFERQWMKKFTSLNKKMTVVDSSKGIRLIGMDEDHHCEGGHHNEGEGGHHQGGKDPHVWLSPNNAVVMAANIRNALIKADPQNEEFYRKNTSELILRLLELKEEIERELSGLENRGFMIFHPAWGYFAADFDLQQVAFEVSGKDPTPKQLGRLIKLAREKNVKVIFVSPQFNQKSARMIADEIDGRVEFLDPLSKDYIKNLRKAARAISGKSHGE